MKKILLFVITMIVLNSCKKSNDKSCYECHVNANGDDTIICDKSKAQLDAMQTTATRPNVLYGGCIKK